MSARQLSPAARALLADPAGLRAKILAERARRSGSRSFAAFVKQAWAYVLSVDPLVWNWHLDALCLHLEAVARGEVGKLVINIAPGLAKSVLVSVLWPAWIWTWWPRCQFLFGSYKDELAVRDSVRSRAVIKSDWYQATHARPGGWRLREDQDAKGYFVNSLGGERYSTGVGGHGRRAHVIGLDDPLDAAKMFSKAAREEANLWVGQIVSQRFVDPARARLVLAMSRLHVEDPSAFVLSGGDAEHLCLPSEFDPARRCVTHRSVTRANGHVEVVSEELWRDPRTQAGEALFPERIPRRVLEGFKRPGSLGPQGYAAQHQQAPVAHWMAGKYFRRDWFKPVPNPPPAREVVARVRRWDLASTEGGGDWTVGWRVSLTRSGVLCVEDVKRAQLGPHGVRQLVRKTAEEDGRDVAQIIPQDPGQAGKDQAQGYATMLLGYTVRSPRETGDKVTRAGPASAQCEAGNVTYVPGPWCDVVFPLLEAFPDESVHDDDVDALSGAVAELSLKPVTTAELWGRVDW